MMRTTCVLLAVSAFLSGCASVKQLQAVGGSKADGVVEMAYEFGAFESPQPAWGDALFSAVARCQAWGYTSAEAFGGTSNTCQQSNEYGCVRTLVTARYQCTSGVPPTRDAGTREKQSVPGGGSPGDAKTR